MKSKVLTLFLLFAMLFSVCSCDSLIGDADTTNPEETTTFLTSYGKSTYSHPQMPYSVASKHYVFSSYEEMLRAIVETDQDVQKIHADKTKYEKYYGAGYTRLIDSFAEKGSIPVPMLNGKHIAPSWDVEEESSWGSVRLSPLGQYAAICEIWYQLDCYTPGNKDLWIVIAFPSCADLDGIEEITDVWDMAAKFGEGCQLPGEYKNLFVEKKEITLADRTVSARVTIPKENGPRLTWAEFLYDGMWVYLNVWDKDFLNDDFFKGFSIGEYSIAPSADQSPA